MGHSKTGLSEKDLLDFLKARDQQQVVEEQDVVIYTPHPKQRLIAEDPHRYKVACVGRQFGKTEMALGEGILSALETPNGVFWYIAPFFAQAKDIAWARLKEKLSLLPERAYRLNESELTCTFHNGAVFKLMGAENPDRLRGAVLDGIICDEFAFWTKGDTFPKVIRLALAKKQGWAVFISTPNGYNFFYDLFCLEATAPDEWKSFHYTSYDNPYLQREEIERIKATSTPLTFQQEVMAEFNKPEGAIWSEFSRAIHVIPRYRPSERAQVYGSLDFGFAIGHPTSLLLHEIDDTSDIIKTFDGFLQEGKDPSQIVAMVDQYTRGITISAIYCDSARPDLIAMLKKAGFPARPADKDVELGIAKVAEFMRVNPLTNLPRWQICGHLKEEIAQIESYHWQQVRTGEGHYKSVPVKQNDDAPDSLRYFLYTHTKPQKDLNTHAKRLVQQALREEF